MLRTVLACAAVICAASPAVGKEIEWKWVAGIGSIDHITQIHVTNLLESNGIDSSMEGSITYGVSVPKQQAAEATRILHADAKKNGYWIEFGEKDSQEATAATLKPIRQPIDKLLTEPDYAKDKPLGRFLRSKELSAKLRGYPFVENMKIKKRDYLATKDKTEVGYEVWIELHATADGDLKGCRYGYQVYDHGREVQFQGGSEWVQDKTAPKR